MATETLDQESILSRLDRLDNILRQLEEIRHGSAGDDAVTPKSSCASTVSSGTGAFSVDFSSPGSLEKHCRPMDDVMTEVEQKGTLIERLAYVEHRILKMEEEIEAEKKRLGRGVEKTSITTPTPAAPDKKAKKKMGLKQLVKSCVKGKRN